MPVTRPAIFAAQQEQPITSIQTPAIRTATFAELQEAYPATYITTHATPPATIADTPDQQVTPTVITVTRPVTFAELREPFLIPTPQSIQATLQAIGVCVPPVATTDMLKITSPARLPRRPLLRDA